MCCRQLTKASNGGERFSDNDDPSTSAWTKILSLLACVNDG